MQGVLSFPAYRIASVLNAIYSLFWGGFKVYSNLLCLLGATPPIVTTISSLVPNTSASYIIIVYRYLNCTYASHTIINYHSTNTIYYPYTLNF